jgi:glycosyltransferase involved in cell wall biosynthesis
MTRRVVRELDSASGLWAVDAQVAVSDYALRQVAARRHARTLLRIYNGIDLERFTLSDCTGSEEDRPVTIGFVGRLIADKGAGVLLRALAQMRVRDAVVRIAGDGPERVALEQLAVALGIAHRAEFLGEIFDVASFWHRCDIAAVPSHVPWVESFGLVAVEAMACGCAVVVSASGALPEIVSSGLTGTVVPENDPAALATALDEYATNRVLRAQHGQQARMDCERRFAIVDCAREYEELFHSLLDSEDRYPRTARLPKIHGHPPVRWTRGR